MQVQKEGEKTFCSFGYDYISDYIGQRKKGSAWNETQLHIIVETLVNFIDCYTEGFMKASFPADPVWVFEQLLAVNAHIQKHGYAGGGDLQLKKLEEPLFQFRNFMKDQEQWLVHLDIINTISKPHQLIIEWFDELDLPRYNKKIFTAEERQKQREQQREETHAIVSDLLLTAINSIKKTDAYQQAVASGKLYYKPEAGTPPKDAKPSQSSTKSTPVSTPSSSPARGPGFFDSFSSSVDRSQQSSSSSQEKGSEQSNKWGFGNSAESED
jgi:hypothetical protein